MAGIYIHIPYCKVKCHYCDFHFSTQLDTSSQMLQAVIQELEQRHSYLASEKIKTIYFGGGTPSFVSSDFLIEIIQKIRSLFSVEDDAEITAECNPDDINSNLLEAYRRAGINRFSMGVQSFDDDVLKFMNRAHSSHEIFEAIVLAKDFGFNNITIDLIYGIPNKNLDYWKSQLDQFLKLDVPHLSSYCLTIEPKTVFGSLQKKGTLSIPDDEVSLEQFQYLIDFTKANGYEHYEISNFAKPGFISKHNSNYWLGENYLGIGPSAHSYNSSERSWNIRNNAQYIRLVNSGKDYNELEILSNADKCNDYILTRLRTKWGVNLSELNFISESDKEQIKQKLITFQNANLVFEQNGIYLLTDSGKYRADGIAADLFI
jgi:oxygen-independent coproporphyrinogen-3 oxidase